MRGKLSLAQGAKGTGTNTFPEYDCGWTHWPHQMFAARSFLADAASRKIGAREVRSLAFNEGRRAP